jgi:hypothetical protein
MHARQLRLPFFVFSLCLLLPAAPTLTATPDEAELDWMGLSPWFFSTSLSASGGYRNNVLLSSFQPIGSSYGRAEVEVMAIRQTEANWEFIGFLQADYRRYLSPPPETDSEQLHSLHAEAKWQVHPVLKLSAVQQGYYQDIVLDVSSTEAGRVIAPLRTLGSLSTLRAEVTLPGHFVLAPGVQYHVSDFTGYAGDFDEVKPSVRLGWSGLSWLSVSIDWQQQDRSYDERQQFTAGGRPLAGTQLEHQIEQLKGRVTGRWSWHGDWKLLLGAGEEETRDNGSGYFDFDRRTAEASLDWSLSAWTVSLNGQRHRDIYLVQTIGTGIAPPPRRSEARTWSGRAEYAWNDKWTLFVEFQQDELTSNDAEFAYAVTTTGVGVSYRH